LLIGYCPTRSGNSINPSRGAELSHPAPTMNPSSSRRVNQDEIPISGRLNNFTDCVGVTTRFNGWLVTSTYQGEHRTVHTTRFNAWSVTSAYQPEHRTVHTTRFNGWSVTSAYQPEHRAIHTTRFNGWSVTSAYQPEHRTVHTTRFNG
jgi:hypothetical protein